MSLMKSSPICSVVTSAKMQNVLARIKQMDLSWMISLKIPLGRAKEAARVRKNPNAITLALMQ